MTLLEYDGWNDDIWGKAEFLHWSDDWGGLRLKESKLASSCRANAIKKQTNEITNKQTNKQRIGETLFDDWGGVRLKDGASFLMQGKCNKQTKKQRNK